MSNDFKSKDKKIQILTKILSSSVEKNFIFEGHELKNEDVFGHYGALALFLIEAQELYEKVANGKYTTEELIRAINPEAEKIKMKEADLKADQEYLKNKPIQYKFPIAYYAQEENTFFSFIPRLSEEIACDFHLVAHYVHHTVEEYIKKYENKLQNGRVPLDELYNKMIRKINDRDISIIEVPYGSPAKHLNKSATIENMGSKN